MIWLVLRAVVASTLLGAAVIHAAQAPSHFAEWWAAGATFVALAAAQAILGAAAVWADRRVWLLAQAVSLAAIGLWALSRTVGLPVGPEAGEPEPVGRADLVAVALEAATLVAATPLAWPGATVAGRWPGRSASAGVVAVALLTGAVTWYGLQPTSVCGGDHDADQAQLGPLAPVEGHSLLPASTPIAIAGPGQRVGLVVGLLRNCATAPITIQAAQLLNQDGEGHTASSGRFLIASVPPARPGIALPAGQLASDSVALPGQVTVAPTPEVPTQALILSCEPAGRVPSGSMP